MSGSDDWRPIHSQLTRLVDRRSREERQRRVADDGELIVPWQVPVVDGPRHVTVHYFTAAFNDFVRLEKVEGDDEVRLTVHERWTSGEQSGEHRSASVVLDAPLAARRLVDGATGGEREAFTPDAQAGWATFDLAVADRLLFARRAEGFAHPARTALADGCDGAALRELAAGGGTLEAVHRERGVPPLDHRRAATLVVGAALARARSEWCEPEAIGSALREVVETGHLDPELVERVAPLLRLHTTIGERLDTVGSAQDEVEAFIALARAELDRGGFGDP